MSQLIFDDEYTGPRWTYGLRNRPVMLGTVPKGYIIQSDRQDARFRHGTIDYLRALTDREIYAYELELVSAPEEGG